MGHQRAVLPRRRHRPGDLKSGAGCSRHGSRIDAAVRGELASAGVVATSSVIELRPLVLPEGILSGMPVLIGATSGTERHSLVLEAAAASGAMSSPRSRPPWSNSSAPPRLHRAARPRIRVGNPQPSTPNSADAVSWNTMPAALY